MRGTHKRLIADFDVRPHLFGARQFPNFANSQRDPYPISITAGFAGKNVSAAPLPGSPCPGEFVFDGSSVLQCSAPFSGTAITLSCWLVTTQAVIGLISTNNNGGSPGWHFTVNSGKAQLVTNWWTLNGATNINTGKPVHVIACSDAAGMRIYVNGKLDASTSNAPGVGTLAYPWYVGNSTATPGTYTLVGRIGRFKIFNAGLTNQEAFQLYQQECLPYRLAPSVSDYLVAGGGNAFTQGLNEALLLSDSRSAGAVRGLLEVIAFSDTRAGSVARTLFEIVAFADSRSALLAHLLAEMLGLSDSRAAGLVHLLLQSVVFTDGVGGTLNAGGQALIKILTEALTLNDVRTAAAAKITAEFFGLSDTRKASALRILGENLGFTDSRSAMIGGAVAFLVLVDVLASTDDDQIDGGVA